MYLERILNIQNNLDRLFGAEFFPNTTYSRQVYPPLNLFEKNNTLILKVELPGLSKENIKIQIHDRVISLGGERIIVSEDQSSYHRQERESGNFNRQFRLPYEVDSEKVMAELEEGILTITLEKHKSANPKTISIK